MRAGIKTILSYFLSFAWAQNLKQLIRKIAYINYNDFQYSSPNITVENFITQFLHRGQEIRNTTFDRFIIHLSTWIFTIVSAAPRKVMHIPSILACQRLNTINIGYEVIETANYWMWNVSEHECYWLPRETEPERIWSSDIVRWWKCRSECWSNFPLF